MGWDEEGGVMNSKQGDSSALEGNAQYLRTRQAGRGWEME